MSIKRVWQSSLLVLVSLVLGAFSCSVEADVSVPYEHVVEKIDCQPFVVGNCLVYYSLKGRQYSNWHAFSKGNTFYFIDRLTGKQVKKFVLPEYLGKHLLTTNNISYFYSQNDGESDGTKTTYYLIAYDLLNAKKMWSTKVLDIWDTFCTDASKIYFVSCKTGVVAVNLKDGTIAWRYQLKGLKDDYWGHESCAIKYISSSKSLVCAGRENIFSLDCATGKSRWTYKPKIIYDSNDHMWPWVDLALDGDNCLYSINNCLGLVSLKSGTLTADFGRIFEVQSFVPLNSGALVFYAKNQSKIYYRLFQGSKPSEERFLADTSGYEAGAKELWHDSQRAYVNINGKELACLDYRSGKMLWRKGLLMKDVPQIKGLQMANQFFVLAREGKAYRDEIPYLLCMQAADGKNVYSKSFDTLFAIQQDGKRLVVSVVDGKIYSVDPPSDKFTQLAEIR